MISFEAAAWPFWVTCYNDDKCLINHWVMVKSTQIALLFFHSVAFYGTETKQTHMQSPLLLELRQGPATMLQTRRLCLESWQISEALTYPKYALTHMWQQPCVRCVWASTPAWFTAKPKKHGPSGYQWSFLTEPGNSINAPRYQPFHLSLRIYSCSIQQHFKQGQLSQRWWSFSGRTGKALSCGSSWSSSPFNLTASGVRDQYHSDQCHSDYVLPKYILANSKTAQQWYQFQFNLNIFTTE